MLPSHPCDIPVLEETGGVELENRISVPVTLKAEDWCKTHGINNVHHTRKLGRMVPDEGERNAGM